LLKALGFFVDELPGKCNAAARMVRGEGDSKGRSPSCYGGCNLHFQRFWLLFVLALAEIASSQNGAPLKLVGVGSTAALPVYSKWFQSFEKTHVNLHFSYMPFGSEAGVETVTSGTADFGGGEFPLTTQQLAQARLSQFPTLLIALVPIYNLPGIVKPIRFSAEALAGIFLGTVTQWNDPAITRTNPGLQLPASDIAVIHSGNGRGSTYIWSDYLSKVSVEWRTKVGRGMSIQWPAGKPAEGNGNLARMVRETPNSIGNVELAYAIQNLMQFGMVQNAAGNFILADTSSMTMAAGAVAPGAHISITNPPGDRSYPVCSFTWLLISENTGPAKLAAMKDFLRWMLTDGQIAIDAAGFAKLPQAAVEYELKAIDEIP
jgi:phosphate transport system substrate-binding protein